MPLNIEQAKSIPIDQFLNREGITPIRRSGNQLLYRAPYREDKHPSFAVNVRMGKWFDFATSESGDILNLVCKMYACDVKRALSVLEGLAYIPYTNPNRKPLLPKEKSKVLEITKIKNLKHPVLIHYLEKERKISLDLARQFLKEIHFQNKGKDYYALGWQNQSGGYEIRNKFFKSSVGEKDLSLIQSVPSTERLLIFEGMTDFLSWMMLQQLNQISDDVIVLNSLSFFKKLEKFCQQESYKSIELFFDNDDSGKKASQKMKAIYSNVTDNSSLYAPFKDLNEFWVHTQKL